MATEFEELQLTVNLVDNASAPLAKLNEGIKNVTDSANKGVRESATKMGEIGKLLEEQVKKFAGPEWGRVFDQLIKSTKELGGAFKPLGESIESAGVKLLPFARGVGIVTASFAAAGLAIEQTYSNLNKFAQANTQLDTMAKRAGILTGEYKSLIEQQMKWGLSFETAAQNADAAAHSLANFSKVKSSLRDELMSRAGIGQEQREAMERNIYGLSLKDHTQFVQAVKETGDLVYENMYKAAIAGKQTEAMARSRAAAAQQAYYETYAMKDLFLIQERLITSTKEYNDLVDQRVKRSTDFLVSQNHLTTAMGRVGDALSAINQHLTGGVFIDVFNTMEKAASATAKALEWIEHILNRIAKLNPTIPFDIRRLVTPNFGVHADIYDFVRRHSGVDDKGHGGKLGPHEEPGHSAAAPHEEPGHSGAARAASRARRGAMKPQFFSGDGGGGLNRALFGDHPDEDFPLSEYVDDRRGEKRFPLSEHHVDDRRGENRDVSEQRREQIKVEKDLVDELKRLNDLLMPRPGARGGKRGGTATGKPTGLPAPLSAGGGDDGGGGGGTGGAGAGPMQGLGGIPALAGLLGAAGGPAAAIGQIIASLGGGGFGGMPGGGAHGGFGGGTRRHGGGDNGSQAPATPAPPATPDPATPATQPTNVPGIGDVPQIGGGAAAPGSGGAAAPGGGGGGGGSGNLAALRAPFKKELDADPQLKRTVIGAMQHEGGLQSNMEQFMNMAAMRHQTLKQALYSGQYGPVTGKNRIPNIGNISAKTAQEGETALNKVYGGSNITDYATDQGMKGDPNYAKYQSNPSYWGMHKVENAWFSAHGEAGRKWAAAQRARDAAKGGTGTAATAGTGTAATAGTGTAATAGTGTAATAGTGTAAPSGDARLSQVGNYKLGSDPRRQVLVNAAREASKNLPPGWRVEAFSGERLGRNSGPHGTDAATDFRLIDPQGHVMKDYQAPENFAIYERFAQDTHAALLKSNPQLAAQHRFGGYFSGRLGVNPATGKDWQYGAMDLMHQDFAGGDARMAAGQWATGLNKNWLRNWGVGEHSSGFAARRASLAARAAAPSRDIVPTYGSLVFGNVGPDIDRASATGLTPDMMSAARTGRMLDIDRANIDAATTHRVEGTGSIKVDVTAPRGTKVDATGGGLFKSVEVARQTQMEPAASSLRGGKEAAAAG